MVQRSFWSGEKFHQKSTIIHHNVYKTFNQLKMSSQIKAARIAKELKQLNSGTNHHGFNTQLNGDCLTITFSGPKETLFRNETFDLNVRFDDRYPFTPPRIQLLTKIYHPNIDKDGKICLNILTMPPEGAYNPTMTVESIVLSVQLLLTTPNPYDPLRADAASDLLLNKPVYENKVKQQIEDNRKAREKMRSGNSGS